MCPTSTAPAAVLTRPLMARLVAETPKENATEESPGSIWVSTTDTDTARGFLLLFRGIHGVVPFSVFPSTAMLQEVVSWCASWHVIICSLGVIFWLSFALKGLPLSSACKFAAVCFAIYGNLGSCDLELLVWVLEECLIGSFLRL